MHRSGTSAATGTLDALGIATPSGKDRVGRRKWNARGYFESERMMAFNNGLLTFLGGTWSAPPSLVPGWELDSGLDGLRPRAALCFAQTFPSRPMAWKDPRTCITLPFWRTVIDPPLAAVLVYRDPREVGRSLQVRDAVGLTYALALWIRYMRDACSGLVGLPTLVVDYARVLDEPSAWVEELAGFLNGVGVDIDASTRRTAVVSLDPELRHQRAPVDQPPSAGDQHVEMFEVLRTCDGAHDAWSPPDLGIEPDWVEEVLTLRRAADELTRIETTLRTAGPLRLARAVWDVRHHRHTADPFPRL
jgi:hypothetical protein